MKKSTNSKANIVHRNKDKAPASSLEQDAKKRSITEHPLFGMDKKNKKPVQDIMKELRG